MKTQFIAATIASGCLLGFQEIATPIHSLAFFNVPHPRDRLCAGLSFADIPSYKPTSFIGIGDHMAKKRKRVDWTAENVRTLKSMAKKKMSVSKIAKSLKRTEGATRQKAFSIGLSLDSRG